MRKKKLTLSTNNSTIYLFFIFIFGSAQLTAKVGGDWRERKKNRQLKKTQQQNGKSILMTFYVFHSMAFI